LAAGIWLLAAYGTSRPVALGPDAPAAQFSAARADAVLGRLLNGQHPHPAGSAEDAAMRGRILKELDALGVPARTSTQIGCFSDKRYGALLCGTITNIIADVSPGSGQRIILMAHADSVAAGPGAADDASGVATILETIRALKAGNRTGGHPIRALFTDGEEAGLLGAAAYLRDPAARADTGAVINMEARGDRGPSYLFQTSPGDARLIDLYAKAVPHYATSSLYAEIYKVLPRDTDLTPVLGAGITGYNFAFIGNAAQNHTPLDRRETIDPRSLQQHGENALGMVEALRQADLNSLKGANAIYLDILGRWLPRLPARWSLVLSVLAFLLILLAARFETRRSWKAFLMPPLLLLGAVGMGFVLHGLAAWISGEPDPSFAHPLALRLSLALGAFGIALLTAQVANAAASWLWLAGLAVVCAIWAPGVTPYFLFPCLVAGPLLLLGRGRGFFLLAATVAALVVWLPFNQGSEAIMGLSLHPLFMVTAAFSLIALLPLLAGARALGISAALSLGLAVMLAALAGMGPAYSSTEPEPLNLAYVESGGAAWWLADPVAHLPESLRATAGFSVRPQRLVGVTSGYVAAAGAAHHPAPQANVARSGNSVTLALKADGDGMDLIIPAKAEVRAVTVGGLATSVPPTGLFVTCGTPDCTHTRITLTLASSKPFDLMLVAFRHGLPPEGAKLSQARPSWAVPLRSGDRTLLVTKIPVPAR
jgi:hypothetical protein